VPKVKVIKPTATEIKEAKAAKLAQAKAEQVANAMATQVINPLGGSVVPTVRKAVPGKKAAPNHRVALEDESTWSKPELTSVRKILAKDAHDLETEIALAEAKFHSLIMDSGEGAGDDQADAGTKTFEREHEISILSNKRDLLDQTNRALERIAAGTYGQCENCGRPIGKYRLLEANPRATLCMPCREREDRA
jgi:RNA polymerase-binding protein DksA